MVRTTCPKCGTPVIFPAQMFCKSCGAELPAGSGVPGASAAVRAADLKVWLATGVGIVILVVAVFVLVPQSSHFLALVPSANPAGSWQEQSLMTSPAATPLPEPTQISVTSVPQTTVTTAVTTTPPPTTVSPTKVSVTWHPVTTVTAPATTATTAVPVQTIITQITLAVTQVPPQPHSSSYTSSTPGAPYIDPSALEARVHELINLQRQQNGFSSLSHDPFLADIARGHSWDMVTRNFFEHENPDGKNAHARGDTAGYPCVRDLGSFYAEGISENLFMGYRYTSYRTTEGVITSYNWSSLDKVAERTVSGWMDSPGHRENILKDHFILEGIGIAFSPDDKIYITGNFC